MAHFAELDMNNTVIRVVVFSGEGLEGEQACALFFGGGNWKQTSYNATIRKNFAAIGYIYDVSRDAFIAPQPYPSWTLNETTCGWVSPQPYPDSGGPFHWDENSESWIQ